MMARFTLAALLLEIALYAALGLSLAAALACFVLVRASVAAALCLQSRCGSLRALLSETWAIIVIYTGGLLLQRWLAPRDPGRVVPGVLPVVLVHGIYCNAGVWHRLLRALRGTDNLFTLNLEPPLASIDEFARQLAARVEEACRAAGTQRAIIVSHSMGGMVARAWVARDGGARRAARLVTIASPHHGSLLARRVPGRCAGEMLAGCEWLARLEADEAAGERAPITSIYSLHDEFLAPQDTARVEQGRNVALEHLGHLQLLASPAVHRLVAQEIAAARGVRPS